MASDTISFKNSQQQVIDIDLNLLLVFFVTFLIFFYHVICCIIYTGVL